MNETINIAPTSTAFDQAIIERIGANRIEAGANRVFILDEPGRAWLVDAGHLDIFATTVDENGACGRRRYLGRVPAGSVAFGTDPLQRGADDQDRLAFIAVPGLETVVYEGDRLALVSGSMNG